MKRYNWSHITIGIWVVIFLLVGRACETEDITDHIPSCSSSRYC